MQNTALETWSERAPAWRRWQHEFAAHYAGATALAVRAARPAPGARALDLACATGDLTLALAGAVAPGGSVAAVDLAPAMLAGAAERLRRAACTNVRLQQADAQALPFADSVFDAVVCRLAITLFPDPARALLECRRVLKPGGRLAVLSWGPPQRNTLFAVRTLLANHAAPVAAGLPDALRYARPGALAAAFRAAGFTGIRESEHTLPFPWPGGPEQAWQGLFELQPDVQRLFAGVAPAQRAAAQSRVLQSIASQYDGRQVNFTGVVMLGTGEA
ncbi:MAG TPA: class I SAM-dependent methyltransferase [Dehalococcoidia bacterium]|nr:class I SAM-dependent methyltransferase [Dehalococcoidia bacterium]